MSEPVAVEQLAIADDPAAWTALGFVVEGDVCHVGAVSLRLLGRAAHRGVVRWTLSGIVSEELDGLWTQRAQGVRCLEDRSGAAHPNGIAALDHVVAISPALDRTVAALQAAGLDLRRVREEPTPAGAPRQAFFRLGEVVLEVVQAPADAIERSGGPDGPAFFWGLAFKVTDLDATVAALGEQRCSPPRPAVQPGRRIATLRRAAGFAVPVALMTE
jgi:hypothetical protein